MADLDEPGSLQRLSGIADYVLHCAPPPATGRGDPRTGRLLAALMHRGSLPRRLIYISTTGVYGDCGGDWLDETRSLRPTSARGARRVAAEGLLRRFGRRTGCRVSLLRAPGIYDSAERLPLARLHKGEPVLRAADDVFTNHIHADDLARACMAAVWKGRPQRAYNVSDSTHMKMGDYFDLAADLYGLPRPPRVPRSTAQEQLSLMLLSFMSESRRLDNQRMLRELGLRLRYASVAEGLRV